MESDRSVLARAAVEASAAAAAAAADPGFEASAAVGKGKKNRAFSQVFFLVSEGQQAAVTETSSAWTGKKKTKIQSTPTSGDHSSGKIVGGQEHEREEFEGLDWDDDKLAKEIDACLRLMNDPPLVDGYASDDESSLLSEEQLRLLNRRLALCRIRAQEGKYEGMDDESMAYDFPLSNLEENDYYKFNELSFEWYFDPVYCQYDHFQDYQRLMLRDNGEYEDWEYYSRICSTLEGDQEFVQFWEKISSKTELIEWYLTRMNSEPRIWKLFYYHTLKIATGYPNVCKALIDSGFTELKHSSEIDLTWSRYYTDFLFEMWNLLNGEKLTFKDALRRLYDDNKHSLIFACPEFEPTVFPLKWLYKPFLDHIKKVDKADVSGLIKEFVKESFQERQPKKYYEYAKKKLGIAEKIGLIPSPPTKAPRDKEVHDHTVKLGIGSTEG